MKTYNLGIIGFGTVGAGVVATIQKNGELLARRTGVQLVITKVADLDIVSDRGVTLAPGVLGTDAMALIESPGVRCSGGVGGRDYRGPEIHYRGTEAWQTGGDRQ